MAKFLLPVGGQNCHPLAQEIDIEGGINLVGGEWVRLQRWKIHPTHWEMLFELKLYIWRFRFGYHLKP